jgi:hypothetical protein
MNHRTPTMTNLLNLTHTTGCFPRPQAPPYYTVELTVSLQLS